MGLRLHWFLSSALDCGEGSLLFAGRFNSKEGTTGTHWIGSRVGPRAGLDSLEKKGKSISAVGIEQPFLGCPSGGSAKSSSNRIYRFFFQKISSWCTIHICMWRTIWSCTTIRSANLFRNDFTLHSEYLMTYQKRKNVNEEVVRFSAHSLYMSKTHRSGKNCSSSNCNTDRSAQAS